MSVPSMQALCVQAAATFLTGVWKAAGANDLMRAGLLLQPHFLLFQILALELSATLTVLGPPSQVLSFQWESSSLLLTSPLKLNSSTVSCRPASATCRALHTVHFCRLLPCPMAPLAPAEQLALSRLSGHCSRKENIS